MIKYLYTLRAYYFLFFWGMLPEISFAQGLVTCGATGQPECDWCGIIQMVQNLINYGIFLGVMFSSLLFAYAGFLYLTNQGQSENINKAKKIFVGIVWGTIIILGGWLFIDTLMKALVNQPYGPWNSIQCTALQSQSGQTTNPALNQPFDSATNIRTSPYNSR